MRTNEKRSSFAPKNDPLNNRWGYRDVVEMANFTETAPIFLDADSSKSMSVLIMIAGYS